jgi:hypothetical protein
VKQFEYRCMSVPATTLAYIDNYPTHLPNIDALNMVGREGWEAVHIDNVHGQWLVIMKRELEVE